MIGMAQNNFLKAGLHTTSATFNSGSRSYGLQNGTVYKLPDTHCLFCKHCSAFMYDYKNGPFMICCDIDETVDEYHCKCFDDSGYKFDEETNEARIKSRLKILTELEGPNGDKNFEDLKNEILSCNGNHKTIVLGFVEYNGITIPIIDESMENANKEE